MTPTPGTSVAPSDAAADPFLERREGIEQDEPRNLVVLALHQVVLRVAWIFKTESVIMPAVIDAISGAGWVRGCLPVLNRVGQSVVPMIFAERLRDSRLKRRSLMLTTLLMSGPFFALAALWTLVADRRQAWMTAAFLGLYLVFFAFTGLNQLAFGTVQGKLIRAHRRGRLLALSGIIGSVAAVTAAALLMRPWLALPGGEGYRLIFAFTACGLVLAALVTLGVQEPADEAVHTPHRTLRYHLTSAWQVYSGDRSFRRAANVGMLFVGAVMLFPHYRWLAAHRLGTVDTDMAWWVIAQNVGVGIVSPMAGMIADRCGNRLAMRIEIFLSALVPLMALALAGPLAFLGRDAYWAVFALLGITPVTMKTIFNYTLELTDESEHPRYLSTMRICFAVPFLLSPLAGLVLDLFPEPSRFLGVCLLFGGVSGLMMLGGLLTFHMEEPRHREVDVSELPIVRG